MASKMEDVVAARKQLLQHRSACRLCGANQPHDFNAILGGRDQVERFQQISHGVAFFLGAGQTGIGGGIGNHQNPEQPLRWGQWLHPLGKRRA